jgi:hypothetical protein
LLSWFFFYNESFATQADHSLLQVRQSLDFCCSLELVQRATFAADIVAAGRDKNKTFL